MKRVALLVTGKAEEAALRPSLEQIFPDADFVVRPRRDGFTSTALSSPPLLHARGATRRPTNVERLAAALVAEVEPGRRDQKPPDLVILVDDLELVNQPWPERAVEHVREAVRTHIEQYPWPSASTRERAYEQVRARCSFHLFAPMVEAYFFAEAAALARAGAKHPSTVNASIADLESFLVNDPAFLTPPNRPPGAELPPWAIPGRAQHPKSYLQFLCDPTGTIRRAYVETEGGKAALRELDWTAVLAPPSHVHFVRSLIHDLADALEEHEVTERFPGTTHPLTWPPQRGCVLRNV